MKKYFKLLFIIISICVFLSCDSLLADSGVLGFLSVTLPKSNSEYYTSPTKTRTTTKYEQEYYNAGTIDLMDGNYIKMVARVCSASGAVISSVTLDTMKGAGFGERNNSFFEGEYKVKLSRKNSSLWKASHSGTWTYW